MFHLSILAKDIIFKFSPQIAIATDAVLWIMCRVIENFGQRSNGSIMEHQLMVTVYLKECFIISFIDFSANSVTKRL